MLAISFTACKKLSKYEGVPFTEKEPRDWENPAVFNINREDPHATMISFPDEQSALQSITPNSPNYLSLDGTWKFNYSETPEERPFWFFKDDYDTRDWKDTDVPSNWQMRGYDVPVYTNIPYPFVAYREIFGIRKKQDVESPSTQVAGALNAPGSVSPEAPGIVPPYIPHDWNPVGSYKRDFEVPAGWDGKEVFLHFGAVSSAFYVWVNGEMVGYNEDSKVPAEYNITKYLKNGKNSVAVEVYRWSDGSYLEDQDFFRLSGIQRTVFLHARPKTYIKDFYAIGGLENNYKDGQLNLDVTLSNSESAAGEFNLETVLFDGTAEVYRETKEIKIH